MNSVEKRRSGRKRASHRKHSDGGYSDTSSGGSFLDETDREVSNLTDRAFRSLCIGDEAVYNDSDPCSSSPRSQRERQQAFNQRGQDCYREDRGRMDLKRAAHESFSLRVQQCGQDWIHGGMYDGRDPHWVVYGERTQGRVSATFQQSFVEASQQGESFRADQLSALTNGATELSSQHRRSRSRVSSLIRAFNSEGHKDGTELDGKLKEWNDDTSWDKSALMSIKRELSEFSTSYQQQLNSSHFPSAGLVSPQDTNLYSMEVASMAHMNPESSFIGSSHSQHIMSSQGNCNSNFFIHSELSPFKVWRDHNRFPFQKGKVSGFMPCSAFPKWYETPMYKEISLEAQSQGLYRFDERNIPHQRSNPASVAPSTLSHSTSMLQKALAVEKRCESELTGQYPHRKNTRNLGANRIPTQRPSTVSPSIEMSQRVQDTISSVKALQQKIKMMTKQNITTGTTANQQESIYDKENVPFGNNQKTVVPDVSQPLAPLDHGYPIMETSEIQQTAVSPQPVEHPPVRAESRGATPDVRMSRYKSRATNLLFNLKDNRKRVKNTYGLAKFKGLETLDKTKHHSMQEARDIVIDIPDFEDPEIPFSHLEESSSINAALNQHGTQGHNPGLSLTTLNSQSAREDIGNYSEYTHQPFQKQSEMAAFTSFEPCHQMANGQNLDNELLPFTPAKQVMTATLESMRGKPPYAASEIPRCNAGSSQTREYLEGQIKTERHINQTAEKEFTNIDKYQRRKNDYGDVSTQHRWKQRASQDIENPQHPQTCERTIIMMEEELNLQNSKYTGENYQTTSIEFSETDSDKRVRAGAAHNNTELVNVATSNQMGLNAPFSNAPVENPAYYGQQQHEAPENKYLLQRYHGQNMENEKKEEYSTQNHDNYHAYRNQQNFNSNMCETIAQETGQGTLSHTEYGKHILQPVDAKLQFENNTEKHSLSKPDNASAHTVATPVEHRHIVEIKEGQAMAEHIQPQHNQSELTGEYDVHGELSKVQSARLILAGQTGPEKVEADRAQEELTEDKNESQSKVEHGQDKKRKEERGDKATEKQLNLCREEETKIVQSRAEKETDEVKNIREEIAAKKLPEVQDKCVKEEAEEERLKEEHIKTEPAKTEQYGQSKIQQTKTEETKRQGLEPEQLGEEQVGEEQIRIDNIKTEQTEEQNRKIEIIRIEDMLDQITKAEQDKTEVAEENSAKEDQINEDLHETQRCNSEDEKLEVKKEEQSELKQIKEEAAKPELRESVQKSPDKLAAEITEEQQVRGETDNIEQVKTELAKTKAELARIKEKMMSEPSDKDRHAFSGNEDRVKKEVEEKINISENEEHKDKKQAAAKHQQGEDSAADRQDAFHFNRGADDYDRLREKYGFTDKTSTNKNKLLAGRTSNDNNETPVLPPDEVETIKNKQSQNKRHSPSKTVVTAEIDIKGLDIFKPNEITASQYVYSESSKEFKLSSTDRLLNNLDGTNTNAPTDKLKDNIVEKIEKSEKLKLINISQQRDSCWDKSLPLERKPKSAEHSLGQGHESTRAMSLKERAQTKQEILTSRIKAHAEKEISAIKERGFAIRDGFMTKTANKQLASSQSANIRQRPLSQEVPKKQESTFTNNTAAKPQMELPGVQTEPAVSVSSPSSATVPVKSAASSSDFVDHLQKQVSKEPIKSHENVERPPINAQQTGNDTMSTEENNRSDMKSLIKCKEQKMEGEVVENHGHISGKQNERLQDNAVVNTDHLKKKKNSPFSASLVKAQSSKPMETKYNAVESDTVHEDSAASLNISMCQAEAPVADDNVQIMGIMITERRPSASSGQKNDCSQKHLHAQQQEPRKSDKRHSDSATEENKENGFSNNGREAKGVDIVAYDAHPTVTDTQREIDMNIYSGKVQETSTQEKRQDNVFENFTAAETNLQQESSGKENVANIRTQGDKHHQEPPAEKSVLSTVSLPVDVSPDIQPVRRKHKTTQEAKGSTNETGNTLKEEEVKSNSRRETAQGREHVITELVTTGLSCKNDPNRGHADSQKNQCTQPPMKDDTNMDMNPSKNKNRDCESLLLLDDKRHDITPPDPASHLTDNEHKHVSANQRYEETPLGENSQTESDVHIDRIAIRIVPTTTENEDLQMVANQPPRHITAVPSNVDSSNNKKTLDSLIHEEKVDILYTKERNKDLFPANNERETKDGVEKKLGEQAVESVGEKVPDSLEITHQQKIANQNIDNIQVQKGNLESSDESGKSMSESKVQLMEEDYFQVQGAGESNNKSHTFPIDREAVTKAGELPELIPQKTVFSNESCNEGKHDSASDQSKMQARESSAVSNEDTNRRNRKAGENHTISVAERQSQVFEKREAGQVIYNSKQHKENQSAKERQSLRNPNRTGETLVKEKPEVKSKPKVRVSTHPPEISAIADYARLKVIVSEDSENIIQEFPPNKEEGFFPLIQSRHSRRPVFTVDSQDPSVKEKSLPEKAEISSKVNKEPKPLVFPITEKEHQRTGMFKLGEKDRQEKKLVDAKTNENSLDNETKHARQLQESIRIPRSHIKHQISKNADTQSRHLPDHVHQSNNLPLQASSSFVVSRPTNSHTSQQPKSTDGYNPLGNPGKCSSKDERKPYVDKKAPSQLTWAQEETKPTTDKEESSDKNALIRIGEERPEKRQNRPKSQHEDATKQRRAKESEKEQLSGMDLEKRAEDMRIKHMIEKSRGSLAEEERREAQREVERRAKERKAIAIEIKKRRENQREAGRRAEEGRKAKESKEENAAGKEKVIETEQEARNLNQNEERGIKIEEQTRYKLKEEEKQVNKNEKMKLMKHGEEERDCQEGQEKRLSQEGRQRRAGYEERQRTAAHQGQQRKTGNLMEDQKMMPALQEKQRTDVKGEQQRRAAQEERQRRTVQEKQQSRVFQDEKQRRAIQEERQKSAATEEQQKRAAEEARERRAFQEVQQSRAVHQVEQTKASQEEWLRRAVQEQQGRAPKTEEEHRRTDWTEEQRTAKQAEEEIQEKRKQREAEYDAQNVGMVHPIQEQKKVDQQMEERGNEKQKTEGWLRTQREEEERKSVQNVKTTVKSGDGKQLKELDSRFHEESEITPKEGIRVAKGQMQGQTDDKIRNEKREEEKPGVYRDRTTQIAEEKKVAQSMDALQYYAINSSESERNCREKQLDSPLSSKQRTNPSGLESPEDSHPRPYRPHAPASPASSLPRSNTSSPALGAKPSMFRVKDNTIRGSSFTKSVKPRFHKNFAEDFRVGSPMSSERAEEEQEGGRHSAATPHSDKGLNRLAAIKDPSLFPSSQNYSMPLQHPRPYNRRSIAVDDDDSRSVMSTMSEDVESCTTSVVDLADVRGLHDCDRPESACSFSSDASRSLGKPPVVPPKSEKALLKAKRLTTRRIKKELTKVMEDSRSQETSSNPSSSSAEVRFLGHNAVASPHFSSPVSIAHAPRMESSSSPSVTVNPTPHGSFYASPHSAGPSSLPVASAHATAPVSLPVASAHATGFTSHPGIPNTIADVPSSPTLHHANHTAPVTQYHVESTFPQSYPLTQRKVLQDLGSGQYFVVDVPVQVKMKTFFDPETGKYVQLNVRESTKSTSRPQPLLQTQIHVNPHQQTPCQDAAAGNTLAPFQSYPPHHRTLAPVILHQTQQPITESHIQKYTVPKVGQSSKVHHTSPEKTPYMDTVNETDTTYNRVYKADGPCQSFSECDINSQLAGNSFCENDNAAHPRYQPRDIISMSELDDFMELSDW